VLFARQRENVGRLRLFDDGVILSTRQDGNSHLGAKVPLRDVLFARQRENVGRLRLFDDDVILSTRQDGNSYLGVKIFLSVV